MSLYHLIRDSESAYNNDEEAFDLIAKALNLNIKTKISDENIRYDNDIITFEVKFFWDKNRNRNIYSGVLTNKINNYSMNIPNGRKLWRERIHNIAYDLDSTFDRVKNYK